MKIKVPLTTHWNGVLECDCDGLVMGRIGDYVFIGSDGSVLEDGVHLSAQVVPVEMLAEHAAMLKELSEAVAKLRQIIHVTNMNMEH